MDGVKESRVINQLNLKIIIKLAIFLWQYSRQVWLFAFQTVSLCCPRKFQTQ